MSGQAGNPTVSAKPYIAFGPQPLDVTTLPAEVVKAWNAGYESVRDLHRMALREGERGLAIGRLVEIGSLAAGFLESLCVR
jgi:hypothetical protein